MYFGVRSLYFFRQFGKHLLCRGHRGEEPVPFVELASENGLFLDEDRLQSQFVQRDGGLHAGHASADDDYSVTHIGQYSVRYLYFW